MKMQMMMYPLKYMANNITKYATANCNMCSVAERIHSATDMSEPFNPAVVNLLMSDPDCTNAGDWCNAYYAPQNASRAAMSWANQFEYGHWATYYFGISKNPL
jgi:hypothetical protein